MALPNRRGGCGRTMGYWFSIRTPTGTSMTSASCLGTPAPLWGEAGVRPGSRSTLVLAKVDKAMLAVAEPCGCPACFADTGGAQTGYAQTVCTWLPESAAQLGPATRPGEIQDAAGLSDEVDKKLESQQQANIPFRLALHEWRSGEISWLLAVLAPKEVAQALVKKLEESVFKDKFYKRFALTAETKKPMADSSPAPPTLS